MPTYFYVASKAEEDTDQVGYFFNNSEILIKSTEYVTFQTIPSNSVRRYQWTEIRSIFCREPRGSFM